MQVVEAVAAGVLTDLDLGGIDFGLAGDLTFDTTRFTLDDVGSGGLDLSGPLDFSTTTLDLDSSPGTALGSAHVAGESLDPCERWRKAQAK